MLIGMMPIAAMLSAVGYAIWTNYSFRFPIIVSALLMLTGNIVYASALTCNSVWIALIGRFMTGHGTWGPKVYDSALHGRHNPRGDAHVCECHIRIGHCSRVGTWTRHGHHVVPPRFYWMGSRLWNVPREWDDRVRC